MACAVLGSVVDRSFVPMGSTLTVDQLLELGVYLSLEESSEGVIPVLSLFQIYEWSGLPSKDDSVDLNLRTFAQLLRAMAEPDKRYDFGFLERFHFCKSFSANSCRPRTSCARKTHFFVSSSYLFTVTLSFSYLNSADFEILRRSQLHMSYPGPLQDFIYNQPLFPSTRLYGRGLLCAALQDCVDLRSLSLGDPLPQYKHSGPFAERVGSAFLSVGVAPLVASVSSSITAGTPGCVRISAPMQPLFDILVDQKVCTQMVRDGTVVFEPAGQVRCYIDCKWSASADQQDQNLSTWVNHRVKPFLGKASCVHACQCENYTTRMYCVRSY